MSKLASFAGGAVAGILGIATYYKFSSSFGTSAPTTQPHVPQSFAATVAPGQSMRADPSHLTSSTAATFSPNRPSDLGRIFAEFGFPGPVSDLQYRQAYVTSYNRQLRNANWVVEHLTADNIRKGPKAPDRGKSSFSEDPAIPEIFQSKLKDYYRSGYDRGHLVPAADAKRSQEAMDETFFLTNISPQVGAGFNREYWAHLEQFCRDLTKSFKDVYVFSGPLFLPSQDPVTKKWQVTYEVIGSPPNVAVPTHFYKIILTRSASGSLALGAFVLPNAPIANETPLERFSAPLSVVERGSGLNFFQLLQGRDKIPSLCTATSCAMVVRQFSNASSK